MFQIEMKFKSWKYGFNIVEVPVFLPIEPGIQNEVYLRAILELFK